MSPGASLAVGSAGKMRGSVGTSFAPFFPLKDGGMGAGDVESLEISSCGNPSSLAEYQINGVGGRPPPAPLSVGGIYSLHSPPKKRLIPTACATPPFFFFPGFFPQHVDPRLSCDGEGGGGRRGRGHGLPWYKPRI